MIIQDNNLIADEGKILTNGEIFATSVYLGIYDSPSNWQEVEVPPDEQLSIENN